MCRDSIFSTEIYRSGLKFTLHNPETFFNPRPEEILELFNCQTTELNNGNVSTYIDCYRLEIRESRLTNNQKIL